MIKGPDSPISEKPEDQLGRWSTAADVFNIIQNSPSDWNVRVGLFGKWGSGKSSVLLFLKSIATEHGAITVHFNPWGCTDEADMWAKLYTAVRAALMPHLSENNEKIPFFTDVRGWFKRGFSWLRRPTETVVESVNPIAGAVASAAATVAESRLAFGPQDLKQLEALAGGKRIIVLIDDLDRTDTSLIPRLFFGLQEVLDLHGFSFVLAFDPEVVGVGLGQNHQGWGDGLTFLEKIIDYPIWLPEPSDYQLQALLTAELSRYCPTITLEDFLPVFKWLPKNPRSLKRFVRHVWRLNGEIQRHSREEINLSLLILINLFKAEWPIVAHHVFHDGEMLDKFLSAHRVGGFLRDREPKRNAQLWDEAKDSMKATLSKLSLDPVKLEEIFEYVSAIAGMSGYISLENVIYHAQLAEDPHAYTWKEYGELVSSWNEDPSVLRATLELRAEEKHLTIERVVQECFKAACEQYDKFLSRAADDDLEASFKTKLEGAKKEARFLRALAFELGYFGGVNPVLSVEHYVLLMKSFAKWAHFNNHAEYPAMRSAEKQLLLDVVGHLAQPERLYEEVRPWAIDSYVRKEAENALYTAVGDLLAPRVATRALELFERSGGIHSIWPRDEHYGVRRILFDPKGQVLGVKANRDVLLDIFKRAPENAVIAQNSLEFFHMLGAALKGKFDFQAEELEQLKKDHEFILAIWNAATSFPIQPRALGSLMESGDEVKASAGIIELPKKEWMSVNSPDDKAIITPSPKPDVVEATDA